MKHIVTVLLAVIVSVTAMSINVDADYSQRGIIIVNDIGSAQKDSMLSIDGKNATCTSTYYLRYGEVSKVFVTQVLEKKTNSKSFSAVHGARWTQSVQSNRLGVTNTKENLSSGVYRLKTVFTVSYANGKSETITVYSAERTVK